MNYVLRSCCVSPETELGRQTEADTLASLVESGSLGLDDVGGVVEESSL